MYIFDVVIDVKNNLYMYPIRGPIHNYNTRYGYLLEQPRHRLSKSINYHLVLGIKLFNKLPATHQNLPIKDVHHKFYCWPKEQPFYNLNEYFNCEIDIE